MNNLNEILNRYFEGETSVEEERQLRAFFTSGDVPQEYVAYRPLFAYFDAESKKAGKTDADNEEALYDEGLLDGIPTPEEIRHTDRTPRRRLWYAVAGIAASVMLIAGSYRLLNPVDSCFCSDNYVVINGRCYTDIHQVRTLALEALQEVATPTEDYLPAPGEVFNDREIINEQLQELSTLFDE